MLSRVGNRLYWMGRYVERAESSARLIRVYSELFLDLPHGTGIGWRAVLNINGGEQAFADAGGKADDARSIVHFLLADEVNAASLLSTLALARENARTTRDVIPAEAWRVLNELHLMARDKLPQAVQERKRRRILEDVIQRCQLLAGLIDGTMTHGDGYQLARMGWHLERADMTTRIIDVAAALLMSGRDELKRFDNTLWMAVLRSLSAYQMYRQQVRRRVTGPDAIRFLLTDQLFPRSVAYCIDQVENAIASLPRSATPARSCSAIRALQLPAADGSLDPAALHDHIDKLQLAFADLNNDFYTTWFAPADAA
ncbi:MAG: alpha-E domain-containing protein [Gammaproteobacteria bacterium]|jgi:uncharacterized alpha-E superfamily protein